MTKKPFANLFNKIKKLFSKKKNEDLNEETNVELSAEANEVDEQNVEVEIPVQNHAFSSTEQDELKKLREQLSQVAIDDDEWETKEDTTPEPVVAPVSMSRPTTLVTETPIAVAPINEAPIVDKTSPGITIPTEDLLSDPAKLKEALENAKVEQEEEVAEEFEDNTPIQEMPLQRGSIAQLEQYESQDNNAGQPNKKASALAQASELFKKISGGRGFESEQFFHHIYSPELRPKVHRAFLLIFIGLMTYTFGKSIALWMRPEKKIISVRRTFTTPPRSNTADQIQKVTQSNLFNIKQNEADEKKIENVVKKVETPKICTSSDKLSTLPFKIVNTTVMQDTVKSIASVQVRENEVVNIREGDSFETMELGKILRQKIIIKNVQTNECEYLENKDLANDRKFDILSPASGKKLINSKFTTDIKNDGNRFSIKKKLRDEMVTDLSSILTQAKAIPLMNPDGTMSFKMTEIVPGSIYSKLNIQDEDIITNIDGEKIKNINEVMNKFGKIKDIDHIEITVLRNGNEQRLEYSFD
jgi:type II secretory pathway component PulC